MQKVFRSALGTFTACLGRATGGLALASVLASFALAAESATAESSPRASSPGAKLGAENTLGSAKIDVPADFPADLRAELSDIEDQIESIGKRLQKFRPEQAEQSLTEARMRVEEFSIEAELFDDDPIVVRLNRRIDELSKSAAEVANSKKETRVDVMPGEKVMRAEDLAGMVKIPVDMKNVSFKKDVAPIIFNACCRCHSGGRPAGEFDASNYDSFVTMLVPGKPADSHVLDLVTGKAEPRMPRGNQNRFLKEWAEIWTAWIEQGAKFDGTDPKAALPTYMIDLETQRREAYARMPEEELARLHEGHARRHLEIVKPKSESQFEKTDNFLVTTTLGSADTVYAAALAEAVLEELRERFRLPGDTPVWRGRFGLNIFADRVDYIAFARQVDEYDPEKSEFGHVSIRAEYPYLAMTTAEFGRQFEGAVARQVTAAFLKTLGKGKLPPWAIFGYARIEEERWTKGTRVKNDMRLAANLAAEGLTLPKLLGEDLPWSQLAPMSVSFFRFLNQQQAKRTVDFLLLFAETGNCADSISNGLKTTPEQISQAWLSWALKK